MEELSNLFQSRFCFYMPTAHRPRCFQKVADVKPSTQLRMAIPGAKVEWGKETPMREVANSQSCEIPPHQKKNHYGQTCSCRNLGASFVWIVASQFLNKQAGEVYETDCQLTHGEESAGKMYVECDILRVYFLSVWVCIYIYIYTHTGLVWLSTKMVSMPKSK